MKIKFKNMEQLERFCNIAGKYGNVIVSCGSIHVDGESIVGMTTLGLNKTLDVSFNDKDRLVQFESEVTALGIVRQEGDDYYSYLRDGSNCRPKWSHL